MSLPAPVACYEGSCSAQDLVCDGFWSHLGRVEVDPVGDIGTQESQRVPKAHQDLDVPELTLLGALLRPQATRILLQITVQTDGEERYTPPLRQRDDALEDLFRNCAALLQGVRQDEDLTPRGLGHVPPKQSANLLRDLREGFRTVFHNGERRIQDDVVVHEVCTQLLGDDPCDGELPHAGPAVDVDDHAGRLTQGLSRCRAGQPAWRLRTSELRHMERPREELAVRIGRAVLGEQIRSATRFPTGLHHWVYEVIPERLNPVVVRIGARESRDDLAGAVFWEKRLRPLGVPVARILHTDLSMERFGFPFMVLDRLPGTDLGSVYRSLGTDKKRTLAGQMVDLQHLAAQLPDAPGFGYALDYRGRGLRKRWNDVLRDDLRRSSRRIEAGNLVDHTWATRVESRLAQVEHQHASVRPRAFFHDITTKNVIIDDGKLSGIVDVDSMAFGDPLLTVALTRTSLLSRGEQTDYIDFWCEAMGMREHRELVLDVYTALFALNFLSELEQAFNRDASAPVDPEYLDRLIEILATYAA